MTVAMRTVFMFSFGIDSLMPEDFNDEHPITWAQFKIAVGEQALLSTTPVTPAAEVLEF